MPKLRNVVLNFGHDASAQNLIFGYLMDLLLKLLWMQSVVSLIQSNSKLLYQIRRYQETNLIYNSTSQLVNNNCLLHIKDKKEQIPILNSRIIHQYLFITFL